MRTNDLEWSEFILRVGNGTENDTNGFKELIIKTFKGNHLKKKNEIGWYGVYLN